MNPPLYFGDQVLAAAILDQLLHHSTVINIKGESYRLKERKKVELLGKTQERKEKITIKTGWPVVILLRKPAKRRHSIPVKRGQSSPVLTPVPVHI